MEKFLVTGANGCIGSWTVRRLLREGVSVWALDRPGASTHRLRLLLSERELSHVQSVPLDVTDVDAVNDVARANGITHIIHLAALQIPLVKANPVVGATVNVAGTTSILEVAKRNSGQIRGVAYASSAAVWGPPEAYPPGPLSPDAQPFPMTLYGVFKVANEHTARVFWQDSGVSSVGLRPSVVYGPGRDQGMTSPPTMAILAAVVNRPYHIPFGGQLFLQYADDVAASFIRAARYSARGAFVVDLLGPQNGIETFVAELDSVLPRSRGCITFGQQQLPIAAPSASGVQELSDTFHWAPLHDGIADTAHVFQNAITQGLLESERLLAPASP